MNYKVDKNKVMSIEEVTEVLHELWRKGKRSPNTRLNEIVFRLATVCGLRASEIGELQIRDVRLDDSGRAPYIYVRNGKGGKSRDVTIPDNKTIQVFTQYLAQMGKVKPTTCFVRKLNGKCFDRNELAKRFKSAIKCLPARRINELSIHSGRHTAATQLLRTGADISQVRDLLGHSNISVTDMYSHAAEIKAMDMYTKEDIEKAEKTAKENPVIQHAKDLLSDYALDEGDVIKILQLLNKNKQSSKV
jgi:integrase/recombinase XerD